MAVLPPPISVEGIAAGLRQFQSDHSASLAKRAYKLGSQEGLPFAELCEQLVVGRARLAESPFECFVIHSTVDRSKTIDEMMALFGVLPAFANALKLKLSEALKQEVSMFQGSVQAS